MTGWRKHALIRRVPFSVPFYDSQGYGGGILTRLHMSYILVIESVINEPNIYQDSLFYSSIKQVYHLLSCL
jgi:hypothetical protein